MWNTKKILWNAFTREILRCVFQLPSATVHCDVSPFLCIPGVWKRTCTWYFTWKLQKIYLYLHWPSFLRNHQRQKHATDVYLYGIRLYCTCLCHLGQSDTYRNNILCDALSKVTRASTVLSGISKIYVCHVFMSRVVSQIFRHCK